MILEWVRSLGRSALRAKWAAQDRRLHAELVVELESKPKRTPVTPHGSLPRPPAPRPSRSDIMEMLAQCWRDGDNPGYYITNNELMTLTRSLPEFQYPLSRILIDSDGRREIESPNYAGSLNTTAGFQVVYFVPVPEVADSPGFTSLTM